MYGFRIPNRNATLYLQTSFCQPQGDGVGYGYVKSGSGACLGSSTPGMGWSIQTFNKDKGGLSVLRKTGFGLLSACVIVLPVFITGNAQNAPSQPVTLSAAVDAALSNYP